MGTGPPTTVPVPLSTFPGANPQESAGRLVNCYAEPLGDPQQGNVGAPKDGIVWRRAPGLTQHAMTAQSGYRGGLIVGTLSYELFNNQALTVDALGTVTLLGQVPGTKKISIARDQNLNGVDVLVVDVDNGAYVLVSQGVIQSPPVKLNTGIANFPQPNSVSFQDGYLFLTISDGRVFASPLNSIVGWSGLTFSTLQSRSDVTLLRGIPYQGYMFFFTTGHCEVWADQANPAPQFPYQRSLVLAQGLVQQSAIAGYEVGFDDLLWVAQDYGVWHLPQNTMQPVKVSSPDLDRLIETAVKSGDTLEAGVWIFAGKKIWVLQSSTWSWAFNLSTQKWFERSSLIAQLGIQGRWRGVGGHPAFNKWLLGDAQTGAILFLDDTNLNDATTQDTAQWVTTSAPMLMRIESGVVDKFPSRMRCARADFHFARGTGQASRSTPKVLVTGAAAGTGGVVRLALVSTFGFNVSDTIIVAGVGGTVEANGAQVVQTVVDGQHVDLKNTVFQNAYTTGGTATNVTPPPPNVQQPTAMISWSDDGGNKWVGPVIRPIGAQAVVKTGRASVKNTGLTGVQGRRWRVDMADPVYSAFLKATMSDDPSEPS